MNLNIKFMEYEIDYKHDMVQIKVPSDTVYNIDTITIEYEVLQNLAMAYQSLLFYKNKKIADLKLERYENEENQKNY
jgi:hypothetical protein